MAITIPNDPAQLKDLNTIFANILGVAARLAGLAAIAMIVVGGFRYLTAGGDPKAAEQAKHTFTWAIFGLAALVGSWFIIKIVFSFLFGSDTDLPLFNICITGNCN